MKQLQVYLWGFHRITGRWWQLQGPADVETLTRFQDIFARDTLEDFYRDVPHSGFQGDGRPVYTKFHIGKRSPREKK